VKLKKQNLGLYNATQYEQYTKDNENFKHTDRKQQTKYLTRGEL